ncbi:hypothetical protein [Pseudoalteromonas sp. MTN2-4]|uniref:hypothetical protein n=1 Tax=Pseudoalteromonas sp. MTN2-4 TaxID=3056555 RepID=UPI0036F31665
MTSPKIQFNKLVKPHWTEDDNRKASLAVEFVQLLMNDHHFDEVLAIMEKVVINNIIKPSLMVLKVLFQQSEH